MRIEEITFIEKLLYSVSDVISQSYMKRDTIPVVTKDHINDFLTEVDVHVQELLVSQIRSQYPHDAVLAEESGLNEMICSSESRCWVIDPLDGTQNFLRGLFPEFGVSIGFVDNGNPVAGGVILPVSGDMFLAERNAGAYRNGKRMKVSTSENFAQSRVDIDLGGLTHRKASMSQAKNVFIQAGQIRSYGCAVIGFCQVADGLQDAYITFQAKPWDIAAGQLLVEEAGGKVTSFSGEVLTPFDADKVGISSNGVLHQTCIHARDTED